MARPDLPALSVRPRPAVRRLVAWTVGLAAAVVAPDSVVHPSRSVEESLETVAATLLWASIRPPSPTCSGASR